MGSRRGGRACAADRPATRASRGAELGRGSSFSSDLRALCRASADRSFGVDDGGGGAGSGRGEAVLLHAFEMELNCLADQPPDAHGGARRRAAGQIWNVRGVPVACSLDDDGVLHCSFLSRPACFQMLFRVPDARSALGLPATVTRPGFSGCLNWRWLPFVECSDQPAPSIV